MVSPARLQLCVVYPRSPRQAQFTIANLSLPWPVFVFFYVSNLHYSSRTAIKISHISLYPIGPGLQKPGKTQNENVEIFEAKSPPTGLHQL
jgi:hypothetical protein